METNPTLAFEEKESQKKSSITSDQQLMMKNDEKHEKDIIEVRQFKLANRLAKEKSGLSKNGQLENLDLSQNYIDAKFIKGCKQTIADFVKASKLIELNISYNRVNSEAMSELQAALGLGVGSFTLKRLNLRHNILGPESYQALEPFFFKLEMMDISENALSDLFFQNLFFDHISKEEHSSQQEVIQYSLKELVLQDCKLSERTVLLISDNLQKFPSIQNIDFGYNEFDDTVLRPCKAEQEFYSKLIQRTHMKSWENIRIKLAQDKFQNNTLKTSFQPLTAKQLQIADINEQNSLKYILQNTSWIIGDRTLSITQAAFQSMFTLESHIIPRFLHLYNSSISKATVKQQRQGGGGSSANLGIDLAQSILPLECVTAQLAVVQIFRNKSLKSNICILDLSSQAQSLDEQPLLQAIELIKLCSHKLKVLKLNGNVVTVKAMKLLNSICENMGINSIQYLSFKNCSLQCTCLDQLSSQCQMQILSNFLFRNQCTLTLLDLSQNPQMNIKALQHLFESPFIPNENKSALYPHLLSLDISGSLANLEEFKYLAENSLQLESVIDLRVLNNDFILNPLIVHYAQRTFTNGLQINNRRNMLAKLRPYKLKTIEEELFELQYAIIDDRPIKCMEDLVFFLNVPVANSHGLIQSCISLETGKRFTLIPKSQMTLFDPQKLKNGYLQYYGDTLILQPGLSDKQVPIWYCLFESFECSLLDFILDISQCTKSRPGLKLSKITLSHMLLDFYEQNISSSQEEDKKSLIHPSQIVITGIHDQQRCSFYYQLKLLPFETILQVEKKETNGEKDVDQAIGILNEFISQQCILKKVQLYQTLNIWRHVFSVYSKREGSEFQEYAGNLLRAMKFQNQANVSMSYENLQRMIIVMTIIDDIFEVRPHFKKRHTDYEAIERQVNKYLMRFYLKLKDIALQRCSQEDYLDDEDAEIVPNQQQIVTESFKEAETLYMRIVKLLE